MSRVLLTEAPLLLCCTHHKAGAALFYTIFREIANKLKLQTKICLSEGSEEDLDENTVVWFHRNRVVEFEKIQKPYRGIHIVRDPGDVIVSGYLYHQRCTEPWYLHPRDDLCGQSYQEHLLNVDQEEGILFEMTHIGAFTLEKMQAWNYANPQIMEIRLEDIRRAYTSLFTEIFTFLGFSPDVIPQCLVIANKHSIETFSEEHSHSDPHIHLPELQKWKTYFTDDHKTEFKQLYGDLLIALGYETSYAW